ncbi:MAG: hypothetical protein LC798_19420 [Chloroflexi bacterium]|nr:hypothetical protein [Chloroflexota bacterium]
MADDYTTLNAGTGGDVMDEEGVTFGAAPTTRKRARVEVAGAAVAEIARVTNAAPTGTAYALVTRPIQPRAATPTQTSVAASVTNVTVLASNANRLGVTVFNDSATGVLFLKLGATASTTSFTVKMAVGSYYEVPFGYTGIIDGLWDVASGNARVTELAA